MRIVSGKFRGRAIEAPEGRITRPTSDRTRQSIFNIVEHATWSRPIEGARVIDAFAGSGALGIEAMSRGASFCLFIETESGARGCIRRNIETFQLFGSTRIHRRSAVDLGTKPSGLGEPFDLVFLDPPYGYDLVPKALEQLKAGDWLSPDVLIVAETGAEEAPPDLTGWDLLDQREHGAARISCLRFQQTPEISPA